MPGLVKFVVLGSLALAVAAPSAAAQTHRSSFGLTGGWSRFGDLTPGMGYETVLEEGWTAGVQLERWLGGGRFGVRLDGGYGERPLADNPDSDYNVYRGDVALLTRLLGAGSPRWLAPYFALGVGAAHYNAGDASPIGRGAFGDDPVTRLLALGALGADLLPSSGFGLRLELADQVVLPSIGEAPQSQGLTMVHEPRLAVAVHIRAGRLRGAPPADRTVVAAARPAPPEPEHEAVATEAAVSGPAHEPKSSEPEAVSPEPLPTAAVEAEPAAEVEALELQVRAREETIAELEARLATLERDVTELKRRPVYSAPPLEGRPTGLYTVQVGAFVERETAHAWVARLRDRGLPAWSTVVEIEGQVLNRVRVGALPSEGDARDLARMLTRQYQRPVWVVEMSVGDEPPADAIRASLAFIGTD